MLFAADARKALGGMPMGIAPRLTGLYVGLADPAAIEAKLFYPIAGDNLV
jgi:hypothetical protein